MKDKMTLNIQLEQVTNGFMVRAVRKLDWSTEAEEATIHSDLNSALKAIQNAAIEGKRAFLALPKPVDETNE